MAILFGLACVAVAVMVLAFFIAAILPGNLQNNFRNSLRWFVRLGFLGFILFLGTALFLVYYQESQAPPRIIAPPQNPVAAQEPKPQPVDEKKKEAERKEQEQKDLDEMLANQRQEERDAREEEAKEKAEKIEQAKWHVWTIDGKAVKAKFVKAMLQYVYLQTEDKKQLIVEKGQLSEADVKWIRSR